MEQADCDRLHVGCRQVLDHLLQRPLVDRRHHAARPIRSRTANRSCAGPVAPAGHGTVDTARVASGVPARSRRRIPPSPATPCGRRAARAAHSSPPSCRERSASPPTRRRRPASAPARPPPSPPRTGRSGSWAPWRCAGAVQPTSTASVNVPPTSTPSSSSPPPDAAARLLPGVTCKRPRISAGAGRCAGGGDPGERAASCRSRRRPGERAASCGGV